MLQRRRPKIAWTLATCTAVSLAATTRPAFAQLHWDASGELGVEKRFLRARPAGGADAGFGPAMRLTAHIALLPLVRVGAYGGFSYSPVRTRGDRSFFSGGLEFRLVPPIRLPAWHVFLSLGFGYAAVHVAAFDVGASGQAGQGAGKLPGANGGCFDMPIGIGVSHRLRKPIEIGGTLGTRLSVSCTGSAYSGEGRRTDAGITVPNAGTDLFGLYGALLLNVEL
jgi:hypothetical protein